MSIKNEINSFEFQSLSYLDAEIIKNGFFDYSKLLNEDDAVAHWIDNADLLETILENSPEQPETISEILETLNPFEMVAEDEVVHIFSVRKFEELTSYYQADPFLVSIIEVLYKNIDESFDVEAFFEELIELCEIISKSY